MKPQLFGYTTYFLCWSVAAVAGIWVAMRGARRAGFPACRSLVAVCVLAMAILVGSKLLFLVEHTLLPADAVVARQQSTFTTFTRSGFRIPGGILLLLPVLVLVCRSLGLAAFRFGDAALPGAAVALVFIRLGCFLNGCCFGQVTQWPLAVTFPAGVEIHYWQVDQGLIPAYAARTLPVHPLQLYFAALGVALYVLSKHWNRGKDFDGQVWAKFYLVFFGSTFALEFLRPHPLRLNLLLCVATVAVSAGALLHAAHTGTRAYGPSHARPLSAHGLVRSSATRREL